MCALHQMALCSFEILRLDTLTALQLASEARQQHCYQQPWSEACSRRSDKLSRSECFVTIWPLHRWAQRIHVKLLLLGMHNPAGAGAAALQPPLAFGLEDGF